MGSGVAAHGLSCPMACGILVLVKAMVFPVVVDGCESWITKKAEH